jgi:VanZ family protein
MQPLRFHTFWLAVGWALVLLVTALSLLPYQDLPNVQYNDKIGHGLAYFALMAVFGQIHGARLRTVLLLLAMGALIEVLQGLSGYRDMSFFDWLADAAGVALGWIVSRLVPDLLARLETLLP